MLNADDSAWMQRYVAAGGDHTQGVQLLQKMKLSGKEHDFPPGLGPTAENGRPRLAPPSNPVYTPGLFTSTEAPVPPAPEPAQQAATDQPEEPQSKKRGRPPVNWKERPKTQQELDLFELSLEIEEKNAAEHGQLGFIATAMIYASLPHSQIDSAVFKRKSGNISLTILNDPDIGLPYGKIPRVITAFLCTEAKRTGTPEISLGDSQTEFAKKLGLKSGGGVRGDLTRLKDQAFRLFTSHITLVGAPDAQLHWRNVNLTDNGMLLWNPHKPSEKSAWESKLTLSQVFFDECIDHSVPIDLRVIHKLTSPLAIDIYAWLTYRLNSIAYPTPISWEQIKWQFGANYADDAQGLRNFIVAFRTQLRRVMSVYPEAKVSVDSRKLTLIPSASHIKAK